MSVFDRRHRWGPPRRRGIYILRTCQVCGRIDEVETMIPDEFVEAILSNLNRPNPYRTLFR